MPETEAIVGKGTSLAVSDTDGGSYVEFAEVKDCPIPGWVAALAEATHYQSPDGWTEKLPTGWKEGEAITVTLNYRADKIEDIFALGGVKKYYMLLLMDGSGFKFPGVLTKAGGAAPNKDVVTQTFELTPVGKIEPVAGT